MKKIKLSKTILCLSLSLLVSGATVNTTVFASTINQDKVNITSAQPQRELINIKKSINSFLNSKYDVMKTWNYNSCSNIIKDSKLLEWKDKCNKFNSEWYRKVNLKIDSYSSNLNIDNIIKTDDETYVIDVTYDIKFQLQGTNSISTSMGEKYRFEIKEEDNQYHITKMLNLNEDVTTSTDNIETDNDDVTVLKSSTVTNSIEKTSTSTSAAVFVDYDNLIDSKISSINNQINNIDAYYEKYNTFKTGTQNEMLQTQSRSSSYSGYNSSNAVSYAHIFAEKHNSAYSYYTGKDCTNFVSQCVNSGLIPTTNYWKPYNRNWNTVNGFHDYMTNNGYATSTESQSGARLGDVVQLYNPASEDWTHSVILTGTDSSGWVYCAHSNDRTDYPLADGYSDGGWSNLRTIKFWH
ncbi:hypothetical protein psyc5s11_36530 [Clostridium gelidum]|uniref:Putative amidase domain-containing protein n=1 Tax=Clostridium gelidum TaxID=704125 RepID=A0ABN6IZN5_9CLOT|nr:amidase domain-containing protein [Clostridium gelidum]BCZ47586.1 hypothetical protein psyc5s11_36530 [Clostridium gelidum]